MKKFKLSPLYPSSVFFFYCSCEKPDEIGLDIYWGVDYPQWSIRLHEHSISKFLNACRSIFCSNCKKKILSLEQIKAINNIFLLSGFEGFLNLVKEMGFFYDPS